MAAALTGCIPSCTLLKEHFSSVEEHSAGPLSVGRAAKRWGVQGGFHGTAFQIPFRPVDRRGSGAARHAEDRSRSARDVDGAAGPRPHADPPCRTLAAARLQRAPGRRDRRRRTSGAGRRARTRPLRGAGPLRHARTRSRNRPRTRTVHGSRPRTRAGRRSRSRAGRRSRTRTGHGSRPRARADRRSSPRARAGHGNRPGAGRRSRARSGRRSGPRARADRRSSPRACRRCAARAGHARRGPAGAHRRDQSRRGDGGPEAL